MKVILTWLWNKRMARTMKQRLAIYRRDSNLVRQAMPALDFPTAKL